MGDLVGRRLPVSCVQLLCLPLATPPSRPLLALVRWPAVCIVIVQISGELSAHFFLSTVGNPTKQAIPSIGQSWVAGCMNCDRPDFWRAVSALFLSALDNPTKQAMPSIVQKVSANYRCARN
eukprot:gnl/TRDRNA2_/TRDRNA2_126683_c0_seq1.p1 gnl/TRDRNA2_/TRDRNA2_126683_c0~~gnl/TRDRNA2_/TRDRNA2_126683_c0_seq1.p1  ORF type:complete len:122 (-),score=7.75 gnl/TRDRNA2_/TRDRNA2_126683_c0_seq1:9-374(-)